jgi:hypothetical protein
MIVRWVDASERETRIATGGVRPAGQAGAPGREDGEQIGDRNGDVVHE